MTIATSPYHGRTNGHTLLQMIGEVSLVLFLVASAGWTSSVDAHASAPTRAEVRAAQQQLHDQGLDPGEIDGGFGQKTREAIKQFQSTQGLEVTGDLDAPTRAALRSRTTPNAETAEQLRGLEQRVDELSEGLKTVGGTLELNRAAIVDNTARLDAELKQQVSGLNQGIKSDGEAIASNREIIDKQIKRLDASIKRIDQITLRLGSVFEQTQQHAETLDKHEKHLKDNSVKIYETLIKIDKAQELAASRELVQDALPEEHQAEVPAPTYADTDLRLLLSLTLCLLVPLGALLHQSGFSSVATGADNHAVSFDRLRPTAWVIAAWVGAGLGFLLLGFGTMYGTSLSGWVGTPLHFFSDLMQQTPAGVKPELLTVLAPQVLLAAVAGVIVSSAVPNRLSALGHLITALLIGGMIYPLFGHWTGAERLLSDNKGWLTAAGFTPSGGATGVALLAGVAGLSLANGLHQIRAAAPQEQEQHTLELNRWTTPGALLLWVAWYGVILTTSLGEPPAAPLLLATYLAMLGAGLVSLVINRFLSTDPHWQQRLAGAALAGLIAAPGAYTTATAIELTLLGLVVGGLHTLVLHLLRPRLGQGIELAASVAVGGLIGTLGPALFGPDGFLLVKTFDRIQPQLLGLGAAVLLAGIAGKLLAWPTRWWAQGSHGEGVA